MSRDFHDIDNAKTDLVKKQIELINIYRDQSPGPISEKEKPLTYINLKFLPVCYNNTMITFLADYHSRDLDKYLLQE